MNSRLDLDARLEKGQLRSHDVLIICAAVAHGDEDVDNAEGQRLCLETMTGILSLARAGGYKHCEILETLLAQAERSTRLEVMATGACDAAGALAVRDLVERIGLFKGGWS